jgi:type I restriction enzyme M protein
LILKRIILLGQLLLSKFKLLAVVNCHKDTFQPHTGVRTCLVFVENPKDPKEVENDYNIYLAISKKIGQDSEGFPIFKRDKDNNPTEELDHDLDDIYNDYIAFIQNKLVKSEYRFSINKSEIDELLRINPQVYLPNLNETIKNIESIDGKEGWSVTTIGQIEKGIKIFKGPRLKSENLVVEQLGENVEPYYTPTAVLQEKGESAKLFNLSIATKSQINALNAVRVYRGDIVITRSGTIGRVAFITKRLNNAIVSDDLIRVRIKDEYLRHYVYSFLKTKAAYDQMIRNEYGAVQQHLEPNHIKDILIPIPDNWETVRQIVESSIKLIDAKELLEEINNENDTSIGSLLKELGV